MLAETSHMHAHYVAQWCVGLAIGDRGFKSQPLHCRVQLWTSCSHTLSSASDVTTSWRYIK